MDQELAVMKSQIADLFSEIRQLKIDYIGLDKQYQTTLQTLSQLTAQAADSAIKASKAAEMAYLAAKNSFLATEELGKQKNTIAIELASIAAANSAESAIQASAASSAASSRFTCC
jgi:hypothetical protein